MIENKMLDEEYNLAVLTAGGDKAAFRIIYDKTYGRVFRYVKKLVRNDEMAEDVITQTYTAVWEKSSSFRGTGRLTTWIIGIARNIAFNEFRKNTFHSRFSEEHMNADRSSQNIPEHLDRKEKLKQAISALSPKHEEIIELVFFQDLTYPEVSGIINIPVNTVKTRVFHAKQALKRELSKRNITYDDI
ncbi:MAG: sigma-70 family RNA polymerase sigma factor [Saprospiraceae bacterium]|nr:sigma-70 family RNA polymerase sigma factor [Saprospiraceae bacterium]